jgi:X breakpoint 2-interacting protein
MDTVSCVEEYNPTAVNSEPLESGSPTGTVQLSRRQCTEDTLESWTQYLNNEVTALGFPSILKQSEAVEVERGAMASVDVVQLVGCMYDLLQQHRADIRGRDIMAEQFQRCQSDKEQLIVARERLKNDLATAERELDSAVQQQHCLEDQLRAVNTRLQSEREELKKVRSVMVQRSVHYNHEVKKWERESSRLKEKLHQVLSDRSQDRKIGIEMANFVQREGGKRRMWKTGIR